jgi:hypothetical protein
MADRFPAGAIPLLGGRQTGNENENSPELIP